MTACFSVYASAPGWPFTRLKGLPDFPFGDLERLCSSTGALRFSWPNGQGPKHAALRSSHTGPSSLLGLLRPGAPASGNLALAGELCGCPSRRRRTNAQVLTCRTESLVELRAATAGGGRRAKSVSGSRSDPGGREPTVRNRSKPLSTLCSGYALRSPLSTCLPESCTVSLQQRSHNGFWNHRSLRWIEIGT